MPTVDLGLVVGSNGKGVPTGGSAGQILAKNSSSNYDTGWVPMSAAAAAAFGIVETGNAASQTIAAGQYVIWKGVLYTADAAIASGTTLAASGGNKNLTAVSGGGLNALNRITTESSTVELRLGSETGTVVATGTATHKYCGPHHWVTIIFSNCNDVNVDNSACITGTNYLPIAITFVPVGVRMGGAQYFVLFGQRLSASIVLRSGSIDNPGAPKWTFASANTGIYISYSWIA